MAGLRQKQACRPGGQGPIGHLGCPQPQPPRGTFLLGQEANVPRGGWQLLQENVRGFLLPALLPRGAGAGWRERSSYCVCVCVCVCNSHVRLCDPMDCSQPGSSVHGILQARILEWVAISFSRASSQPRDRTHSFLLCGRILSCLSHQGSPLSFARIITVHIDRGPQRNSDGRDPLPPSIHQDRRLLLLI